MQVKFALLAVFILSPLLACTYQKSQPLPAGVTLLEVQDTSANGLLLKYEKYRLDNGLTLLLHHDDSDPLVNVDVTYHAGSAREELGKSGFAHFFEHMMFQGSKHVADQQHFKIVNESGGTMNGSTSKDRTNYYQTVPANQLEKVLWLEADRMGFLLDAVDQAKFEIQRSTVKNERAQRFDNVPYGLVGERLNEALYRRDHPYSWPPIGYLEDLDRVNVNDLKAFFLRWYGPNNAVLTIGGDFDKAQTLQWVARYFSPVPEGPPVPEPVPLPAKLDKDRYVSMQDKIHLPLLYLAYPTVHLGHQDEVALDMAAYMLGRGNNSILFRNLVKTGYAMQAGANHRCDELACNFTVYATANPEKKINLAKLRNLMDQSLAELAHQGVTEADIKRAQSITEASTIFSLQSVSAKVKSLAIGETLMDDPNYAMRGLDAFKGLRPWQVQKNFDKYVYNRPRLVFSVVPEGSLELVAEQDNYQIPPRVSPQYQAVQAGTLSYLSIKDNFDRSKQPPTGPPPVIRLPELWRKTMVPSIRILGSVDNELPTINLQISLKGGRRVEPVNKVGIAALTAAMMNQSTQNYALEELSETLQSLGSSVEFYTSMYSSTISVKSLTKNFTATMALVEEKLLYPAFEPEEFERVKRLKLQSLKQNSTKASWLASQSLAQILYGQHNILGYPATGTIAALSSLTLDDVKSYYHRYYVAAGARVTVVGDISPSQVQSQLHMLTQRVGVEVEYPDLAKQPDFDFSQLYLIDQPGSVQSVVHMGHKAIPFDITGAYFQAGLMNFNLGGNFNSRLNQNLRERKGLAYGANSYFAASREQGTFIASASVKPENTAQAVEVFLTEITEYIDSGVSESELSYLRDAIVQRDALSFETPTQKLGFLLRILIFDLQPSFVGQQNRIIAEISKDTLHALAIELLNPNKMQIVVVGDMKNIRPQLEALSVRLGLKLVDWHFQH